MQTSLLPALGLLLLTLWLAGCASTSSGVNARLIVVEGDIDRALAADDLAVAMERAIEFEDRLPGADSYAALGEVLWRSGDLIDAEAMHRRAVASGAPRGYLGLARASLARGRLAESYELANRAAQDPAYTAAAAELLAAAYWASGRSDAAADLLLTLGRGEDSVTTEEAALVASGTVPPADEGSPDPEIASAISWSGEPATLALMDGARVRAHVGGSEIVLRVVLDGTRSALPSVTAARLTGAADAADAGRVVAAPLAIGSLRAARVLFAVRTDSVDEGVLGFDVLSTLSWLIDLQGGSLQLSREMAVEPAGIDPPALARTHWITVRVPRRGFEAQLLLTPRLRGTVVSATVDLAGASRVGRRMLAPLYRSDPIPDLGDGETLDLELRMGGWKAPQAWVVTDLLPLAAGGAVAPQAVLGVDVLSRWRLRWRPDRQGLSIEEHMQPAAPTPLPLQ